MLCHLKDFRLLMRDAKEYLAKFLDSEKAQVLFYDELIVQINNNEQQKEELF